MTEYRSMPRKLPQRRNAAKSRKGSATEILIPSGKESEVNEAGVAAEEIEAIMTTIGGRRETQDRHLPDAGVQPPTIEGLSQDVRLTLTYLVAKEAGDQTRGGVDLRLREDHLRSLDRLQELLHGEGIEMMNRQDQNAEQSLQVDLDLPLGGGMIETEL